MKKILIISSFFIIFLFVLFVASTIYFSFFKVKPTAKNIHNKIEDKLTQLVYFPKEVTKSYSSFEETSYIWEMETPQKEHVAVELVYTPSFSKNQEKITATLRMEPRGDASIFDKVLPALLKDADSLKASRDLKNLNPEVPANASFNHMTLDINEEKSLLGSISWEFEKSRMVPNAEGDYKTLGKYPRAILKFYYLVPQFLTRIFSGV